MDPISATIERPTQAGQSAEADRAAAEHGVAVSSYAVLQDQMRLWAADAPQSDDDDIIDDWLASLRPADFEQFLNLLADDRIA